MSSEAWAVMAGFDGRYRVSNLGRIESTYTNPLTKRVRIIMLRPAANKSGHLFVYLGKGVKRYVHRMVLETFVGPAPEGHECLHADDQPANNVLTNLSWGTRAENIRAMIKAHPGMRSRNVRKAWETRRATHSI